MEDDTSVNQKPYKVSNFEHFYNIFTFFIFHKMFAFVYKVTLYCCFEKLPFHIIRIGRVEMKSVIRKSNKKKNKIFIGA